MKDELITVTSSFDALVDPRFIIKTTEESGGEVFYLSVGVWKYEEGETDPEEYKEIKALYDSRHGLVRMGVADVPKTTRVSRCSTYPPRPG